MLVVGIDAVLKERRVWFVLIFATSLLHQSHQSLATNLLGGRGGGIGNQYIAFFGPSVLLMYLLWIICAFSSMASQANSILSNASTWLPLSQP